MDGVHGGRRRRRARPPLSPFPPSPRPTSRPSISRSPPHLLPSQQQPYLCGGRVGCGVRTEAGDEEAVRGSRDPEASRRAESSLFASLRFGWAFHVKRETGINYCRAPKTGSGWIPSLATDCGLTKTRTARGPRRGGAGGLARGGINCDARPMLLTIFSDATECVHSEHTKGWVKCRV